MSQNCMHIVLFKWKEDVSHEKIEAVLESLRMMKHEIPFVLDMTVGTQNSQIHSDYHERSKGFTHGMTVTLTDGEDLKAFRDHPMHKRCVAKLMSPIVEDIFAFDYFDTTDPPGFLKSKLSLGAGVLLGFSALLLGAVMGRSSRGKMNNPNKIEYRERLVYL